jgi:hypothetical protein
VGPQHRKSAVNVSSTHLWRSGEGAEVEIRNRQEMPAKLLPALRIDALMPEGLFDLLKIPAKLRPVFEVGELPIIRYTVRWRTRD